MAGIRREGTYILPKGKIRWYLWKQRNDTDGYFNLVGKLDEYKTAGTLTSWSAEQVIAEDKTITVTVRQDWATVEAYNDYQNWITTNFGAERSAYNTTHGIAYSFTESAL